MLLLQYYACCVLLLYISKFGQFYILLDTSICINVSFSKIKLAPYLFLNYCKSVIWLPQSWWVETASDLTPPVC